MKSIYSISIFSAALLSLSACTPKGVTPTDAEIQNLLVTLADGKAADAQKEFARFDANAKVLGLLGPSIRDGQKLPATGSLLHIASMFAEGQSVQTLLDRRADVKTTDNFGLTPLHTALLSDEVVSPPQTDSDEELTDAQIDAFLKTLHTNQLTVVRGLLAGKAPVDAADYCGRTPLFFAAIYGLTDSAKELLERGAKVDHADSLGDTALHAAARNASAEFVALLLDRGAKVNAANNRGRTALHEAAAFGNLPVEKVLLERGADAALKDKDGFNAVEVGWMTGEDHSQETAELLKTKGISLSKEVETGAAKQPEPSPEDESLPWTCAKSKLDIEAAMPTDGEQGEVDELTDDSATQAQETLNDLVQGIQVTPPK